ncbi:prepilin-type N-terminal cleavage/methylation domain-containing protein [Acidovorax delafieldii]|uniref:prepilin-type N-terminal cleavage/methylation domain-containing protein n=1 Tax=Acidovorax delafieldii TaxID=47920 RepID=UPI003F50728A
MIQSFITRRSEERGFTLVELLVVMTLLSLVMVAMASALRTASQTEERVDVRLQRVDDLRTVSGFLRSILGRVSAQKIGTPVANGASPYFFSGSVSSMSWVGVMPARYGAGGRYHFRLELTDAGILLLQYMPWEGAAVLPDWASGESTPLLAGVTGLTFQYEDAAVEPPDWSAQWMITDRLPDRVSISVRTNSGPWPEIVVPLRVLPGSDPRTSGPVFGGT